MSLTQHRDLWVATKQLAPEKLLQLKGFLTERADLAIRAVHTAKRDASFASDFQSFYAAIDALAVASRDLSHVSHLTKFVCDWQVPPVPEFNEQFINQFYLLAEFKRTF